MHVSKENDTPCSYQRSNKGQTLNINNSEATVKTIQNMKRKKDGPTFVPVGSLNASPPISGMWKPRGNIKAAKQNTVTATKKISL